MQSFVKHILPWAQTGIRDRLFCLAPIPLGSAGRAMLPDLTYITVVLCNSICINTTMSQADQPKPADTRRSAGGNRKAKVEPHTLSEIEIAPPCLFCRFTKTILFIFLLSTVK